MSDKPSGIDRLSACQELGVDEDLRNEEVVFGILERGIPEEVERFRAFHNLTREQVDLMKYYAQLRRITVNQMQEDIARRIKNNPRATEEEIAMGGLSRTD